MPASKRLTRCVGLTCTNYPLFLLRALNTQIPRLDDKVKAADRILQRLRGSSETMAGLLGNLQRLLDGYIALSHTSTQVRVDIHKPSS